MKKSIKRNIKDFILFMIIFVLGLGIHEFVHLIQVWIDPRIYFVGFDFKTGGDVLSSGFGVSFKYNTKDEYVIQSVKNEMIYMEGIAFFFQNLFMLYMIKKLFWKGRLQ